MCNLMDEEGNEVLVIVVEYVINDLKEDELVFYNFFYCCIFLEVFEYIYDQEFVFECFFVVYFDLKISMIVIELVSDWY